MKEESDVGLVAAGKQLPGLVVGACLFLGAAIVATAMVLELLTGDK